MSKESHHQQQSPAMRITMRLLMLLCTSSLGLSQAAFVVRHSSCSAKLLESTSASTVLSRLVTTTTPHACYRIENHPSAKTSRKRRRQRGGRCILSSSSCDHVEEHPNVPYPYSTTTNTVGSPLSPLWMAVSSSSSSSSSRSVEEEVQKQQEQQPTQPSLYKQEEATRRLEQEAQRYKAEAQRIRLEAEQMDVQLTLRKIQSLELQLSNVKYLQRHPDQQAQLHEQLLQLQSKLQLQRQQPSGNNHTETTVLPSSTEVPSTSRSSDKQQQKTLFSSSSSSSSLSPSRSLSSSSSSSSLSSSASLSSFSSTSLPSTAIHPLNGFDPEDLQLYLPIALEIESKYNSNSTNNSHNTTTTSLTSIRQQLQEFQTTPQLQQHFQIKIRELLQEPLQDLELLQQLQQQYWHSTSDIEKQQLKRQIQQLETSLEERAGTNFEFTDSIYISKIQPMSAEELQQRRHAIQQLPKVLQALYVLRCGVKLFDEDGGSSSTDDEQLLWERNIELAIMLEHYEHQLDVLDQVYQVVPLSDGQRQETQQAIHQLPPIVRHHLATQVLELDNYNDADESDPTHARIVNALEKGTGMASIIDDLVDEDEYDDDNSENDSAWNTLKSIMREVSSRSPSSTPSSGSSDSYYDNDDLDFIDRSRYLDEFYPSVTRLDDHPRISRDVVDAFCARILQQSGENKKKPIYMIESRPERVAGGYYLRGENQLSDDDNNGIQLVQHIQEAMKHNPDLRDQLEFFYIPDPAPLSDEKLELGYDEQSLILLTSKNPRVLYDNVNPLIKLSISALGLCSTAIFALGASVLQPTAQDRINAALEAGTDLDVSSLAGNVSLISISFAVIVLVHELAHRIVAWSNKFDVGLPTVVPSVQTGITGTITSLASPPPNVHALFDFAMAGPMAGLLASMTLLTAGLSLTAATDMTHIGDLPALPMYLLRTSTLGGDMIELFLGKGTLMRDLPSDTVLPLHPYAVSGFIGILVNALALLPLGHTDGGRISLSMFGRRGAYVVSAFTHVLLCLVGLFGFDQAGMILVYNLYTVIWQRKLETPCRNEVDQLDLGRGAFGIAAALLVALALTPML